MFIPLIDEIPHGLQVLEALLSFGVLPGPRKAIRESANFHEYILTTTPPAFQHERGIQTIE